MDNVKHLNTLSVATITTGIVLVHGFEGVGEAFEHILGHPVWTHEMPRYGDRAKDLVVAQYPDFPTEMANDDWQAFADEVVAKWGPTIAIKSASGERDMDPVSSLVVAVTKARSESS